MHEHDRDIIMALAEGRLGPEETAAAEAELFACARCAEDLMMQRTALAALHGAADAEMTELESARMRRNLRHDLGLEAAAPEPRRRTWPLAALGAAAVILLIAIAAGPALQNLSGGEDGDGAFDIAGSPANEAATTTAASAATDSIEFAGEDDLETAERQSEEAPAATAAPATTEAAAETASGLLGIVTSEEDVRALADLWLAERGDVQAALQFFQAQPGGDEDVRCGDLTLGALDGASSYDLLGRGEIAGREVEVVGYRFDPFEDSTVIAHDVETCDQLATGE